MNKISVLEDFHNDLKIAKELVYDKDGFDFTKQKTVEGKDYGACSFELNGKKIQFRVSKITPTKTGQFVSIWKRNNEGITQPFDVSDELDFIIISVRDGNNFGQFIFPKSVLADKGIITQNNKEGKRGIRVYPPWEMANNKHAEKTQDWQTKYFLNIKNDSTDVEWIKRYLEKID